MPAIYVNPGLSSGSVLLYSNQTVSGIKTFNDGLWSNGQVKIIGSASNLLLVTDSSNHVLLKVDTTGVTSEKDVTANSFTAVSARDKKDNITDFDKDPMEILNNVKIVNFNFKDDPNKRHHIGFIADDSPLEVSVDHQHYDMGNCIGILIKAVQDLSKKVEDLEAKIVSNGDRNNESGYILD